MTKKKTIIKKHEIRLADKKTNITNNNRIKIKQKEWENQLVKTKEKGGI